MLVFFKKSEYLDWMVLKPLSHIRSNWDLSWDEISGDYLIEEDSFAKELNDLMDELDKTIPPSKYHNNEDLLADYVIAKLKWKIEKIGNRWEGASYNVILEQGGFGDKDEQNLIKAAAGRIKAAKDHGSYHFDEMEEGHRKILADVISIILYHREKYSCT